MSTLSFPATAPSPTDCELLNRFKEGDESAFTQLVTRYRTKIHGLALRWTRNQEDAEEITQDAFLRVHRSIHTFRGECSFYTWIYRIARNLARNRYWYWFRRKRHQTCSLQQPVGEVEGTSLAEFLPSGAPTPGERLVRDELVERISTCMEALPKPYAEVLYLRNVEQLSYVAIAEKLDLNVGTVKSRIARARECLRNAVDRELDDWDGRLVLQSERIQSARSFAGAA